MCMRMRMWESARGRAGARLADDPVYATGRRIWPAWWRLKSVPVLASAVGSAGPAGSRRNLFPLFRTNATSERGEARVS